MTINFNKTVRFPEEFKSKLFSFQQSNAAWGDYVNARGSENSPYFHFERDCDSNSGDYDKAAEKTLFYSGRDGQVYENRKVLGFPKARITTPQT